MILVPPQRAVPGRFIRYDSTFLTPFGTGIDGLDLHIEWLVNRAVRLRRNVGYATRLLRSNMTTPLHLPAYLQPRVDRLIEQAKDQAAEDNRGEQRFPLFQPVTLRRGSQILSAFSRDVSEVGIGLLHDMPIGGKYTISIQDNAGGQYDLPGVVLWCRPCGQGWYISGVGFCRNEPA